MKTLAAHWLVAGCAGMALAAIIVSMLKSQARDSEALTQARWYLQCAWCNTVGETEAGKIPTPPPPNMRQSLPTELEKAFRCAQSPSENHDWQQLSKSQWIRHRLTRYKGRLFDLGGFGNPELDLTVRVRYDTYGLVGYPGATVLLAGTARYFVLPVPIAYLTGGPCLAVLVVSVASYIWRRLRRPFSIASQELPKL